MQGEQAAAPLVSAPHSSQPAHSSCLPEAPQPPPPAKDAVPQPQQQVAGAEDKPQTLLSEALPTKTPVSTMKTIQQAASKAQQCQKQAAKTERDGQQAGPQSPAASENICVMDVPQVPANNGAPSGSAVTLTSLPQQDMCRPSSMHKPSDMNISSSEAGGAGLMQIQLLMAEAPPGLVQQQVGEPEPKPMAAEVHGLQQYPAQADVTTDTCMNRTRTPVHRQQLRHHGQQAVTPTKYSQRSSWRRYGRVWRWV